MLDLSRAKRSPFSHQVYGTEWLVDLVRPEENRLFPGGLLLGDEMRLGKTKQVIDAACYLYDRGEIDQVFVVSPAPVRDVWFDPDIGELHKHLWGGLPVSVMEYHQRDRVWQGAASWATSLRKRPLEWVITNYEFIRTGLKRYRKEWNGPRLAPLLERVDQRTLIVLDESSAVSGHKSLQSRACLALRRQAQRVWLLNGTPMSDSPEDYFAQAFIMDWKILGCRTHQEFMSRYAVMGGFTVQTRFGARPTQVLGWYHAFDPAKCGVEGSTCDKGQESAIHIWDGIGDLQQRLAPYILRRERKDCMDLPPKLEPVALTAVLKPETWRIYKELRDDLAAWFDDQTVVNTMQAGVRVMRLSQICSGFVGGVETLDYSTCDRCGGNGEDPEHAGQCGACEGLGGGKPEIVRPTVREIGREKLDVLLDHVRQRMFLEPDLRMLVWCRFRAEHERIARELAQLGLTIKVMCGGQKKSDRLEALKLMHPEAEKYSGPAALVGTVGTGSMGLNLAGAHEEVFSSNDWSLLKRKQSEDRPIGPGQTHPLSIHDIVAVGPKGQRTVDHEIVTALRNKENLATWTMAKWIRLLREE